MVNTHINCSIPIVAVSRIILPSVIRDISVIIVEFSKDEIIGSPATNTSCDHSHPVLLKMGMLSNPIDMTAIFIIGLPMNLIRPINSNNKIIPPIVIMYLV